MHPCHLHVNSQVELQHVVLEWGSLHHIYHKCQYLSFVRAALPLVVLHKPVKTIIPTVLKFRVSVCSDPPPVLPPQLQCLNTYGRRQLSQSANGVRFVSRSAIKQGNKPQDD